MPVAVLFMFCVKQKFLDFVQLIAKHLSLLGIYCVKQEFLDFVQPIQKHLSLL